MRRHILLTTTLTIIVFNSFPVLAASFDCHKATQPIEHLICENKTLNNYDNRLGKIYHSIRANLKKEQSKRLRRDQRTWIVERNVVCHLDVVCLIDTYEERIRKLLFLQKIVVGE